MKLRIAYIIITVAVMSAPFFSGCLRSVGKCTYGKEPAQHGKLVVKSVEKIYSDKRTFYRVHVDGFFKRDFIYSEDEFFKKFTSKGYKSGSYIEGNIISGGPCPPAYSITD